MNIRVKDLNLLVIFESLMGELNVSKAAQKLGLSQPAMSNALARLREDLGDPLFVRAARGVKPTPKALALKDQITDVLRLTSALYEQQEFDPKQIKGRFNIASTDFFEHLALGKLLPELAKHAPKITLVVRPTLGALPKQDLEDGRIDLAIAGFFGALPEGFYQQKLSNETYSCVVRLHHPVVKTQLTLEQFTKLEHILVSPQGDLQGVVDRALAKKKLTRRIACGVSNFHSPAMIVESSDYIATVPTRIALSYAKYYKVKVVEPPLSIPSFQLFAVWHGRTHRSPQHQWMRQQIAKSVA